MTETSGRMPTGTTGDTATGTPGLRITRAHSGVTAHPRNHAPASPYRRHGAPGLPDLFKSPLCSDAFNFNPGG